MYSWKIASDLLHLYKVHEDLFHSLQDLLVGDYKSHIFSQMESQIHASKMLQIGLYLLKTQNLEKPVIASNIIPSITPAYWQNVHHVIYSTEQFHLLTSKVKNFYKKRLDTEINTILGQLPLKVDLRVQQEFRQQYYKNPLSFDEFLELASPSHTDFGDAAEHRFTQSPSTVSPEEKLVPERHPHPLF